MLRRSSRWFVTPGPGLALAWLAVMFGGLLTPWSAWLPGVSLAVGAVIVWASMLLVAALVPPPAPLAAPSALLCRILWFLRVTWAAVVFGAAALYGGVAGLALEASGPENVVTTAAELIAPVLTVVVFAGGWYAVVMCAWDLLRVGPTERDRAIATALNWAAPRIAGSSSATPSTALLWLGGLVRWCANPIVAGVFGYLAPGIAIGIWNSLSPSGNPEFGLF